jgi:hypothetical protein
LKEGLEVKIVERAKEIGEVRDLGCGECLHSIEAQLSFQIGAGIQVPPNASRVLAHYGLV